MVSVVEELKTKLTELDARLVAINKEVLALEGQKAAFMTVIKVFDPDACDEPWSTAKEDGSINPWSPRDRPTLVAFAT